ncbi:MAG: hypothetical protein H6Q59_998 [Firmicutes bacterium]|nr:hypothetical protein [Bacillota bacterium]
MGTVLDFYNEYHNSDWVGHDFPEKIAEHYEIKACLKMNEDKQVYLMTSKTNWKKYILKALACHCHENLEEEYKLSRELSHPGIIAATEYIKGKDYNYLIREYVEGYTVTELVEMTEEGHLQNEELFRITIQLCDILEYLHSQKPPVIHRDIKPDNIIITKQKDCKLIDFGISRRYQGKVDSDTFVMGTQYSAPPEQYGFAQTSVRSDIYSIGVLILYMATGSLDIRKLKNYSVSEDIQRIIRKCTEFSPKDRYTSVKQLRNKLISYPFLYKKRRMLITGIISIATLALIIGVSIYLPDMPRASENIPVANSNINTPQSGTVLTDTPSKPAEQASSPIIGDTTTAQETEEITLEPLTVASPQPVISDIPALGSVGKDGLESDVTDSEALIQEDSGNDKDITGDSDIDASVMTPDSGDAVQAEVQENPAQEEKTDLAPATVIGDERVYDFKSPLIAASVRELLGKSATASVTYHDLEQITSLFICGQQSYNRWEEHFVYGVNQYMNGAQYTDKQLYTVNGEITNLEDISHMVNLEKLALYNQKISDLTPLQNLHYLSYLGLGSNNISDLTQVVPMKSLNYLDISNNPIMNDDLEVLKELPYLWGLDLGATKITSVYGIKDLKLSFLSLFECKMGDCIGLDEITTLDNLIITGVNNAITDRAIDRIIKLTNLRILKIFGSDSIDLSRLSSLKSLYLLDLCGMWNSSNLKDLSNPVLSQLYIDAWQKLDLTGIEKLSGVELISIHDSVCSDYSPLLGVKNLKKVFCNQEQQKKIKEQLGEVPFEVIAQ